MSISSHKVVRKKEYQITKLPQVVLLTKGQKVNL